MFAVELFMSKTYTEFRFGIPLQNGTQHVVQTLFGAGMNAKEAGEKSFTTDAIVLEFLESLCKATSEGAWQNSF